MNLIRDEVKDKFLPCLRCFHSLVKRTEEAKLGLLIDAPEFNNLIQILVWTKDYFLISSTCLTLLDICKSLYGHLHFVEALSRTKDSQSYKYSTYPIMCALKLIKARESDHKSIKICCVS